MSDVAQVDRKDAEWRVYKPKKTKDGAASKLELKVINTPTTKDGKTYYRRNAEVFLVSTKQTGEDDNGNASFGWSDSSLTVTAKLGETDLGEILALLNWKKKVAGAETGKYKGIFHKNDKGSTSILLERSDNGYYSLRIAKKVGNDGPSVVSHTISFGEAEVLKIVIEAAIRAKYNWH